MKCIITVKTKFIKYHDLCQYMSEFGICHMCNRPANKLFEGAAIWSSGKEFCSQECINSHKGAYIGYTGFGFTIVFFLLLLNSGNSTWIFFFIFGLSLMVYGSTLNDGARDRKELHSDSISNEQPPGGVHFDPQDQLIYSNILKAEVHPCCHQSARLNDQYCACGRAIDYP